MRNYPTLGLQSGEVLLPKNNIDLALWSVVACDQFTAEPEYWEKIECKTQSCPSTYYLVLPEAYLGTEKGRNHQAMINPTMEKYLREKIFRSVEGFIYIEREIKSGTRQGLLVSLDLEKYDFDRESTSLIRATEGTIIDRLPPRIEIRKDAPLELPHILVLIDDPDQTVIQPLASRKNEFQKLYDFDLLADGGHIRGFQVDSTETEKEIIAALEKIANPAWQRERYGTGSHPLLYAVGDGNHSLATAKSIWQMIKGKVPDNHPARFAMVELVNLHDPSIIFEPIHRVAINIDFDLILEMRSFFDNLVEFELAPDFQTLKAKVEKQVSNGQVFGLVSGNSLQEVKLADPPHTLTVGSLQKFLDVLIEKYPHVEVDYIHGDQSILELGAKKGNAGFILPAMNKHKVFEAVIKNGPLPRKTFSMGEANEKRYYLECRKIRND